MTTLSILINKKQLNINQLSPTNIEYVENYITYKLFPYKQLNYFHFNTFSNEYIDGLENPNELKSLLTKNSFNISSVHNFSNVFIYTNRPFLTQIELNEVNNHIENYCIIFCRLYH